LNNRFAIAMLLY